MPGSLSAACEDDQVAATAAQEEESVQLPEVRIAGCGLSLYDGWGYSVIQNFRGGDDGEDKEVSRR